MKSDFSNRRGFGISSFFYIFNYSLDFACHFFLLVATKFIYRIVLLNFIYSLMYDEFFSILQLRPIVGNGRRWLICFFIAWFHWRLRMHLGSFLHHEKYHCRVKVVVVLILGCFLYADWLPLLSFWSPTKCNFSWRVSCSRHHQQHILGLIHFSLRLASLPWWRNIKLTYFFIFATFCADRPRLQFETNHLSTQLLRHQQIMSGR